MDNSAFVTHELTVCTCESCSALDARDFFNQLQATLRELKMDAFVHVSTLRFKKNHHLSGAQLYVTLDGNPIEATIENICRLIRKSY